MWNKLTTALAAVLILCACALHAQRQTEKIPPPLPRDLVPLITMEQVKEKLDTFRKSLNETKELPENLNEYRLRLERAAKKEKDSKTGETVKAPGNVSFSSVRMLRASFFSLCTHPDLEEVTAIKKEWFADIYNATEAMSVPAKYLEHALATNDNNLYIEARKAYIAGAENVLKAMKAKRVKYDSEQLQKIKDINRKRREKEYYAREKARLQTEAEQLRQLKQKTTENGK